MNIGFIESFDPNFSEKYNELDLYCPLLPNLCGSYVKDYFNGFLYAYKEKTIDFNELLQYFLKTKHSLLNIGKIRLSSNIYACCTKKKESELFGSNYPITTLAIVDVDITRPWTIDSYDGKEYIKYLDYDVVNEDINYCKWRD